MLAVARTGNEMQGQCLPLSVVVCME